MRPKDCSMRPKIVFFFICKLHQRKAKVKCILVSSSRKLSRDVPKV